METVPSWWLSVAVLAMVMLSMAAFWLTRLMARPRRPIPRKVRVIPSMVLPGAARISFNHQYEASWRAIIEKAHVLDVMCAEGFPWPDELHVNLRHFLQRGGTLRVLLTDPDDAALVEAESTRFGCSPDAFVARVKATVLQLESLVALERAARWRVSVGYHRRRLCRGLVITRLDAVMLLYPDAKSDTGYLLAHLTDGAPKTLLERELSDVWSVSRQWTIGEVSSS